MHLFTVTILAILKCKTLTDFSYSFPEHVCRKFNCPPKHNRLPKILKVLNILTLVLV